MSPRRRTGLFVAHAVLLDPALPAVAIGIVAIVGIVLQLSGPLNHDVGWLLVATNRLLDGAGVYVDDVIEVNPPLVLYLLTPVVQVSRTLGLSEITVFRAYVVLLATGSLAVCARLLPSALPGPRRGLRGYVLAAVAYAFFVFPGLDFGQREHFMVLFVTPYLLALAARAGGDRVAASRAWLVGALAGLGFALKPQYVAAWLALEVGLALRRRSAVGVSRPEALGVAAVGALYVATVFLAAAPYVERVLPLALDTYWAYQKPLRLLLESRELALFCGVAVAAFALAREPRSREMAWVSSLAAATFYLAYLFQATGYGYQRLPFQAVAIVLFAAAGATLLGRLATQPRPLPPLGVRLLGVVACAAVVLALLAAQPGLVDRLQRGAEWRAGGTAGRMSRLLDVIRARGPGAPVYFLSLRLDPTFPTLNYSEARWASRFSHLWLVPALMRARRGGPRVPESLTKGRVGAIEQYLFDTVVQDLRRYRPELILVDRKPIHRTLPGIKIDLLRYFRRDPRFEEIWSHYTVTGRVDEFAVAVREAPR